jgi:preprotein translocase subunit SecG
VTLRVIDDTVEKVKLNEKIFNKRKITIALGYVALIIFAIWFVTSLVMDYYSHIGADIPISP